MNRFTWLRNPLVKFDGEARRLTPPNPAGKFCLVGDDDRVTPIELSQSDLYCLYLEGRLMFRVPEYDPAAVRRERIAPTLDDLPERDRAIAMRRMAYVTRLRKAGCLSLTPSAMTRLLIKQIALDINDPAPPSAISVWRWGRRQKMGRDGAVVFANRCRRTGTSVPRLPLRCVEVIDECIDRLYLARQSGTDVHAEVERLVRRENESRPATQQLPIPSLATIYRHINSRSAYDRAVARYGEEEANRRFRHSKLAVLVKRLLERVEIDHTPLDLFVVDEHQQLPLGRPLLTVAIDKRSRMVLGFHISFGGASIEAVMRCLRHAVLPKIGLRERYPALQHDWPCWGLPELLVADNGLEFHARALESAAYDLGFGLEFGGRRRPFHKGAIERFLKTLNFNLLHKLPGTSFAKYWQRFDFDPLKEALVTFEALVEVIHRWILDDYAQRRHRGISESPMDRWNREVRLYPPELPASAEQLSMHLSRQVTRRVWHYGIQLHGDQLYQSSELQVLRRRYGEKLDVMVRYSDDDLCGVFVQDPENREYIYVPNRDPDSVRGLTGEQHKFIRKYRRRLADEESRRISIAEARASLRELIAALFASKKIKSRSTAARLSDTRSDKPPVPDLPATDQTPPPPDASWDVDDEDLPALNTFHIGEASRTSAETSHATR